MRDSDKAIIIGGGLGGLECGYILAKNGLEVTVLEQDGQTGGCLQTFVRGRALFDTGFHYVGGLGEGGSLNPLFRYFGLLDLPWKQLDRDCFDEVVIGDESFRFAAGHDNFVEALAERFPHQRQQLRNYVSFLKNVGDHIFDSLSPRDAGGFYSGSLFARSAFEFLNETISDPLLRQVLSGTSLKMELNADTLPLYVFAQINNSFIQGAWRLQGGGSLITDSLVGSIRSMGGRVLTDSAVTSIEVKDGKVAGVIVNGGERFDADWVISSLHPASTMELVDGGLRKIYRERIAKLENTWGMFTANIRLKPGMMKYENRNLFIHRPDADLWHPVPQRTESVLVNWSVPYDNSESAINVDLLTPMHWSEVASWADKRMGHRGEDYVQFKAAKTEACLELAEKHIPGLRPAVDRIYTSSPLTYRHYVRQPDGSAFGVRKDWRNTMKTVLAPRTPVENLLLTGQSLNLHGVLGVSMTSLFTCASIIGMDAVVRDVGIGEDR